MPIAPMATSARGSSPLMITRASKVHHSTPIITTEGSAYLRPGTRVPLSSQKQTHTTG